MGLRFLLSVGRHEYQITSNPKPHVPRFTFTRFPTNLVRMRFSASGPLGLPQLFCLSCGNCCSQGANLCNACIKRKHQIAHVMPHTGLQWMRWSSQERRLGRCGKGSEVDGSFWALVLGKLSVATFV